MIPPPAILKPKQLMEAIFLPHSLLGPSPSLLMGEAFQQLLVHKDVFKQSWYIYVHTLYTHGENIERSYSTNPSQIFGHKSKDRGYPKERDR